LSEETRVRLGELGEQADAKIDLAETALLLASLDLPDRRLDECRHRLAAIAQELKDEAARAEPRLMSRVGALREILVRRHGFLGDRETYDDLANANLISVIERRRGLPVALAIIYIDAARRLGWPVEGLNFPGRFLIRLGAADGRAVLDPFDGAEVRDTAALLALLKQSEGPDAELAPAHFAVAGNRDILLRLENNIKARLLQSGDVERAVGILERMLLIAPKAPLLWFEAAAHYARLGKLKAAIDAVERCRGLPLGKDLGRRVEAQLRELKAQLN
jgi:regulator of sirC expression with transglutaminase-like and TPR domain